jgi:hypothetical protein
MVHLKTGEAASSDRGAAKKASMMTGEKDLNIDGVNSESESGGTNSARRHPAQTDIPANRADAAGRPRGLG